MSEQALIRLRLDVSYDGTDFSGWAVQPGRRTVAGALLEALTVLFRERPALVVAGRTDAGVHADGQVAHIDVDHDVLLRLAPRHLVTGSGDGPAAADACADAGQRTDCSADRTAERTAAGCLGLLRRLAGLLPSDLRVRTISVAPQGFDARFAALRRHYRYRISTAEWGVEPAHRRFVLARRRVLDVDAMALAASAMIGLRDFAAFCRPRAGATTVRELQSLLIRRRGAEVTIDVVADAFCHSMVRAIVGTLITVGEFRMPAGRPAELLQAGIRTADIHVAPAHGLTLVAVDYPPDAELAGRSEVTRARRAALLLGFDDGI